MPTPPGVISLTPAAVPSAPGYIRPDFPPPAINGILSPDVAGPIFPSGATLDGKPVYTSDGLNVAPPLGSYVQIRWVNSGSYWTIKYIIDEVLTNEWRSTDAVATPDLVTTWTPQGAAAGTPVVTFPSAPSTIALSPASAPSAPSTIAKSVASVPSAPGTISMVPASLPSAPGVISVP